MRRYAARDRHFFRVAQARAEVTTISPDLRAAVATRDERAIAQAIGAEIERGAAMPRLIVALHGLWRRNPSDWSADLARLAVDVFANAEVQEVRDVG